MQPNSPDDLAASLSRANTTLGRISQNQQANARIANEYARQIAAGTALIAYEMQIQNDLLASIHNEIRRTNALLGSILERLVSIDFSLRNPDYIHSMESVRRGMALLERGLYEDANIEFLGSIDQYRTCTAGFYYLALCQHARGDVESAVSSIKKAMRYGSVEEEFSEESLIGMRACRFLLREYPDSVTSDEHTSIQAILAKLATAIRQYDIDDFYWVWPTHGSRLDFTLRGGKFPRETSVRIAKEIGGHPNDGLWQIRGEAQALNFAFGVYTKNSARVSASLCHDPNQFLMALGQIVEADPLSKAFYDECSQIAIDNYFRIYSDALNHSFLRWLNEMEFGIVRWKRTSEKGIEEQKLKKGKYAFEEEALWKSLNQSRELWKSTAQARLRKNFVGLSGLVDLLEQLSVESEAILTIFNTCWSWSLNEWNEQFASKKVKYLLVARVGLYTEGGFRELAPVLQWSVQVPFELNPSSEETMPKTHRRIERWIEGRIDVARFLEAVPLGLPENFSYIDVPRYLTVPDFMKFSPNDELKHSSYERIGGTTFYNGEESLGLNASIRT